jgi:hypothetical protein
LGAASPAAPKMDPAATAATATSAVFTEPTAKRGDRPRCRRKGVTMGPHQPHHLPPRRAKRHPDPDLPRPLSHHVRHHPVHPHQRQQQRHTANPAVSHAVNHSGARLLSSSTAVERIFQTGWSRQPPISPLAAPSAAVGLPSVAHI